MHSALTIAFSKLRSFLLTFVLALFIIGCQTPNSPNNKSVKPLNVLFVSIDDLGPNLGVYDNPYIVSPNLDAFAKKEPPFATPTVKLLYVHHLGQVLCLDYDQTPHEFGT